MKTMIVDPGRKELLAWKCEREDFEFGAQLVVHPSQQAVFIRDGRIVEILGPGMHILETSNYPFLRFFTKLRYGRYFQAQVYFINHSYHMAMPWWLNQKVRVELGVGGGRAMALPIGASGTMNMQVDRDQVTMFLEYLLGTGTELSQKAIQDTFNSMLNSVIKPYLSNALRELKALAFLLDQHTETINHVLLQRLRPEFSKFGLILRDFYLDTFIMPEEDPTYQSAKRNYDKRILAGGQHDIEYEQAVFENTLADVQGQKAVKETTYQAQSDYIRAQSEKRRRDLEGITSIQEHQFDTINTMIKNSGGSGSPAVPMGGDMTGMMSEMMRVGVGLQMAKEMSGMMTDAMNVANQNSASFASAAAGGWVCASGHQNAADSLFCSKCGQPKPAASAGWTCANGHVNTDDCLFCPKCGQPKPSNLPWTCSKGHTNASDVLFCPKCGEPKGGR